MKKRKNGQIKGGEGRAHRAVWTRARGRRAASRCGRAARWSRSGGAVVAVWSGGAVLEVGRRGGRGRRAQWRRDDGGGGTRRWSRAARRRRRDGKLGQHLPCNFSPPREVSICAKEKGRMVILQRVIGPGPWHRPGPMTHWSRADRKSVV